MDCLAYAVITFDMNEMIVVYTTVHPSMYSCLGGLASAAVKVLQGSKKKQTRTRDVFACRRRHFGSVKYETTDTYLNY
jgi:hypothetical protein